MASSGNLKFSVVLEAVTSAFNKAIDQSRTNYSETTNKIISDSNKLSSTTAAVGESLQAVFNAPDAQGVVTALRDATKELNNTKQGAALTSAELEKVGAAAIGSFKGLATQLREANADLNKLSAAKATPADLDTAKAKVSGLRAAIDSVKTGFSDFQAAASAAMKRAALDTDAARESATKAGAAIYETLNIKSGGALKSEIAAITQQLAAFKASSQAPAEELSRVSAAASARISELRGELSGIKAPSDNAASSLANIGRAAIGFAGVTIGIAAIKQGIEAVVDTTLKFDAVLKQLEFATGSAKQAGIEFDFVRDVSKRLGLELLSSANGFAKLASATKGTRLEGQATRDIFEGVASAAASLSLSTADTEGVLLAVSQIASKGVVSMEELRQQLGERLPPAMAIAAKSMGVTVQELNQLVANGLDSVTFLKAFGPALTEAFAPTAAKNVETLQGSINTLKNQLTELLISLGKGGIGEAVAAILGDIAKGVGALQADLSGLDPTTVTAVKEAFIQLYGVVSTSFSEVMAVVGNLVTVVDSLGQVTAGTLGAFVGFDTATDKISFLTRTIQGVSIALGFVSDGVKAISIVFTLLAGVVQGAFAGIAKGLALLTFGPISAQLKQLSAELKENAEGSFKRAEDQALAFRSSGVAALDAIGTAAGESGARVGAGAEAGAARTTAAYKDAGGKAAATFAELEAAALASNNVITLSTQGGAEATLQMAKAGHEVQDTFTQLAKDIGLTLPAGVKTVGQLGAAFGEVAVQSAKTAALIAKELPDAIGKLNGPELQQFKTSFIAGLNQAGAAAEYVQKAVLDIATAGAKALGTDLTASLLKTSQAFENNRVTLDSFVRDFDQLKAAGVNASLLIQQSLESMLAKANNPAELLALIEYFKTLGKEGKISGQAMADGISQAKDKIDQLTPGINSLAEAFKTFGLKTRAEATATAAKYKEAFDVMVASGDATANELQTAFAAYAQAAVDSNKGVASAFIQAQASAHGLSLVVDETGKVIVQKLGSDAPDAHQKLDRAVNSTSEAYRSLANVIGEVAARELTATEAAISAQQRLNKAKEDAKALEDKRLGQDAKGFATDTTGQTVNALGDTWLSILNAIKGYGVTDDAAARKIAGQFTDSNGKVNYGGSSANGVSLSAAVLRATEEYLRKNPPSAGPSANPNSARSGSSTNSTTIRFVNAAGKQATVTTAAGTSVEDVINVLKQSGATAITTV